MKVIRGFRFPVWRAVAIVAVCTGAIECTAEDTPGGDPPPARRTPSVSGGQTREEMLRRFDLDANGRIDEGEAEAARSRMRRERNDALQQPGLDPVTGRARQTAALSAPESEPEPRDDAPLFPPESPAPAPLRKPGGDEAVKKPAPAKASQPGSASRPPATTGGVRAGAPAVRPGYGTTGPRQDLNAGRPREQRSPATAPRGLPGSAGRPLPQSASPRAATPRPSLFPQGSTGPSAEDIGR